jgi:hypothetical protein
MPSLASSPDMPPTVAEKATIGASVETVSTNECSPGNPRYHEKGGLRTYGDDVDHDREPPVSCFLAGD